MSGPNPPANCAKPTANAPQNAVKPKPAAKKPRAKKPKKPAAPTQKRMTEKELEKLLAAPDDSEAVENED